MKYRTALSLQEFQGLEDGEFGRRRGRGGNGHPRREGRRHDRQEERRDEDRGRVMPARRRDEMRQPVRNQEEVRRPMPRREEMVRPNRPMRDVQASRFPWASETAPTQEPVAYPTTTTTYTHTMDPAEAELVPMNEGSPVTYQQPPTMQPVELVPAMGASSPRRWSKPAKMGPNLKIQAQEGFRAAVIELKPGLYVVAEIADQATRPEFGLAPLLAPLVIQAATRALVGPNGMAEQQPPRRSPVQIVLQAPIPQQLAELEQHQEEEIGWNPRRAMPIRRALTPPAPTTVAGVLPAPAVGRWADSEDLAGAFGCDNNPYNGGRHVG